MNKQRRKEIQSVIDQLHSLQSTIEALRDDEQEYYDNMPENFQFGERGQAAEDAVSYMDDAISSIEEAISSLESSAE